jgi:hypothetical protein
MGLRDRLATVRDYILASFVPAPDHPGRGGMTGESRDAEKEPSTSEEPSATGEPSATEEPSATDEPTSERTDEHESGG